MNIDIATWRLAIIMILIMVLFNSIMIQLLYYRVFED